MIAAAHLPWRIASGRSVALSDDDDFGTCLPMGIASGAGCADSAPRWNARPLTKWCVESTRPQRHVPLMSRRLLVTLLVSAASLGIRDALAAEDSCAVKLFRWQEDCRNLRERQASLGALE